MHFCLISDNFFPIKVCVSARKIGVTFMWWFAKDADIPQFEGKRFGGLENYLYICRKL
jgi:hypothetical protein